MMSTFSFIIAILMSIMSLGFTILSISTGDPYLSACGFTLLIATGVFAVAGFVMLWRGE